MKTVRILLYVFSALFMLSVVFVFLPWDWLNAFMALFGEYVYQAENDPLFLLILGLTFLSLAPVTVGLVWVYQLPLLFYSDAVSLLVVGVLFLVYRWQVISRGASAANVGPAAS
jgi:hypothetical protein